jgi:hypothetical protein
MSDRPFTKRELEVIRARIVRSYGTYWPPLPGAVQGSASKAVVEKIDRYLAAVSPSGRSTRQEQKP